MTPTTRSKRQAPTERGRPAGRPGSGPNSKRNTYKASTRPAGERREDDELIERYRAGDGEALDTLLVRYRGFTRMKAHSYFIVGADRDDIVQEGMIGLYKAIRDYEPDREASFRSFAEVCITRQIITAIKAATRQKHAPLNSYVPLHAGSDANDDSGDLSDILPTVHQSDPLELLVASEEVESMRLCFAEVLSEFEIEVLHLYVEGKTYREIGETLGRHTKAIDNAVQRIKKKVELAMATGRESFAEGAAA